MRLSTGLSNLRNQRAQILLPAVLLAPIFILVVYLLFETAKVSIAKARHQFALDNAAYSQLSSASTYLNALAYMNGPFPHRVFLQDFQPMVIPAKFQQGETITVFDLFYKGGGFPSIGPDYDTGVNPPPAPESNNWGLQYYTGEWLDNDEVADRSAWLKETPAAVPDDAEIPLNSKKLTEDYIFSMAGEEAVAMSALSSYLMTYYMFGENYRMQDYIYKSVTKDMTMFREGYFLNVDDCKKSECGRQSAAQLRAFLKIKTIPFYINKFKFYFSEDSQGSSAGASELTLKAEDLLKGPKLYQFAYLDGSTRSHLRMLGRGVLLKQPFKLPRNYFNINLAQKYKPYVRTRVKMSCPRNSNNCVWPNPLPKYTITLDP